LLKKIKSYGFTLNESAEITALIDANLAPCDRVSKAADKKIATIDAKIQELQVMIPTKIEYRCVPEWWLSAKGRLQLPVVSS
jgi:DNA-binding transcriptional MerR regulator